MTPANIIRLAWACSILVVALGLLGIGYRLGSASGRVEQAQYKADVAAKTAKIADLATKAERIARETEQAHARALNEVADKYEKDRLDDQAAYRRDIAGLDSERLRMRSHWQGCKATAELSGSVTAAALADAAEQLRRADTANLIGIGREADTKERALQDALRVSQH